MNTRLRFEILKRDGFRCRYCGVTALDQPLEIDHVVPASKGGTDDPANLLTACWSCNSGKSNVGLEESRLPEPIPIAALEAQAISIGAYLEAQAAVVDACDRVYQGVAGRWDRTFGAAPPRDFWNKIPTIVRQHSLVDVADAMRITLGSGPIEDTLAAWRYFQGVLKRKLERRAEVATSGNSEALLVDPCNGVTPPCAGGH